MSSLFLLRPNGAEWHSYPPCVRTPACLLWDWLTAVQISFTAVDLHFAPETCRIMTNLNGWYEAFGIFSCFLLGCHAVNNNFTTNVCSPVSEDTKKVSEKVSRIHLDAPLWHCACLTHPAEFTLSRSTTKFDPVDGSRKRDMLKESACWYEAKH